MAFVTRNTRGDGGSGLSTPITAVVCVASVVAALTLGVFAWRFFVWRRHKNTSPISTPTKLPLFPTGAVHLPRKPEPTYLADTEKGLDCAIRVLSSNPSPPTDYSLGMVKGSPVSAKKSAPALNLDINHDLKPTTLPSPLRSSSINPSTKTQSLSSRVSSRMSIGSKKLPRLMTVSTLYVPSLSDELPVRLGETIRMIEEYEDEWCLVQRVGRTDERGVIPRFCLVERQEIIPRTGKRASSGFLQPSTFRK